MRPAATIAASIFLVLNGTSLAHPQETLPECDEDVIGVRCVERRDTIGTWDLMEVIPPVGSQNVLILSTDSFEPIEGIFGRQEHAQLVLSCVENVTNLAVHFGENYMSDVGSFRTLIYKIDDEAPVALAAAASEDNFGLGLFTGVEAIPVIRSLFDRERLLVSATSFTGRDITASFAIDGVEAAAEPLRELCNW
ncbi:type VI secretion system-associated protein TagO [Gymnodinialimonas ceratoperidinii]|uniref:Type VI secretion protein n=1 Tax=Gymnodinialimonas ceratoperidinii TaxID=2856823 RepID=A0A8F6TUY4_9RHOB|nr:type VI secretion system-associated protein TagO [Gymnodinialimonas ceratoperidinii]QXT39447.1 type VI secretion protein [Gymnodinialimonas ceratoperidinii]